MLVCMLDVKQNAVHVLLYFLKAGMMPQSKLNLACVGMYGVWACVLHHIWISYTLYVCLCCSGLKNEVIDNYVYLLDLICFIM